MTKDNNYKRLQVLGNWLNRLLADQLENWDVEELFKDAVKLLDLYYVIPYDHPFFIELDEMTRKDRNWRQVGFVFSKDGIHYLHDANVGEKTRADLSLAISQVLSIFRIIDASRRPWQTRMNSILLEKCEPTEQEMAALSCSFDDAASVTPEIVKQTATMAAFYLDQLYSNIGDKILITGNECKRVKVFVSCDSNNKVSTKTTTPPDQLLPFATIIARVFFDFLLLGGQGYYSFCKNCGIFLVAQRKGRLQFCSGRCRIAYKRRMDKRAGDNK